MTTIEDGDFVVRVWRDEDELKDKYDNTELIDAHNNAVYDSVKERKQFSKAAVAKRIIAVPRVSAVEVKDRWGAGVVVYREWP